MQMQQVKEEETYSVINFDGETVQIPKDDEAPMLGHMTFTIPNSMMKLWKLVRK
jgi:hypothetical protein